MNIQQVKTQKFKKPKIKIVTEEKMTYNFTIDNHPSIQTQKQQKCTSHNVITYQNKLQLGRDSQQQFGKFRRVDSLIETDIESNNSSISYKNDCLHKAYRQIPSVASLLRDIQKYQNLSFDKEYFENEAMECADGLMKILFGELFFKNKAQSQKTQQILKQEEVVDLEQCISFIRRGRLEFSQLLFQQQQNDHQQQFQVITMEQHNPYKTQPFRMRENDNTDLLRSMIPIIRQQIAETNDQLMQLQQAFENKNTILKQQIITMKIKLNTSKLGMLDALEKVKQICKFKLPEDKVMHEVFDVIFDTIKEIMRGEEPNNAVADNMEKLVKKATKFLPKKVQKEMQKKGFFTKIKQKINKFKRFLANYIQPSFKKIHNFYTKLMNVQLVKFLFSMLPYSAAVKSGFNIIGDFANNDLGIQGDYVKKLVQCMKSVHQQLKIISGEAGPLFQGISQVEKVTNKVVEEIKNVNVSKFKPGRSIYRNNSKDTGNCQQNRNSDHQKCVYRFIDEFVDDAKRKFRNEQQKDKSKKGNYKQIQKVVIINNQTLNLFSAQRLINK